MSIIQGSAMQGASRGFYPKELTGSLRFNDDDSTYLSLEPTGTSGGRTKFTYSGWVKICEFSTSNGFYLIHAPTPTASNLNGSLLYINSSNVFRAQLRTYNTGAQGAVDASYTSSMVFRDPSAWYHIVFAFDSTATLNSDETMRLWVNGVLQTNASPDYPSASGTQYLGSEVTHEIGRWLGTSHANTNGYMAEVFFIDGTVYEASDFGETKNGCWVPRNITASDFTMGSNGFHLTFEDDTEVEAFNTVLYRGTSQVQSVTGVGFQPDLVWAKVRNSAGTHILTDSVRGGNKQLFSNLTNAEATSTIKITGFESDGFTLGADSGAGTGDANYSGNTYVAWCWDAGANNASTGHSSITWPSQGGTPDLIRFNGLGFRPDLVWVKNRTSAQSHLLYDSVRGAGAEKELIPDLTYYEGQGNAESYGYLSSFDADGFTFTKGSSGWINANYSSDEWVAWGWDAGDSDPVSNTDGSITSTVKTNGDFSIISWEGNASLETIGHGLSAAPDFFIVKNRDTAGTLWYVYHASVGNTAILQLQSNAAKVTNSAYWNNTSPTSSVITMNSSTNRANSNIAYAWRNVTGKQKFGTYSGTLSSGNTVTTGFRPGFVMVKRTDSANNWYIYDGSRTPFMDGDGDEGILKADTSDAESTASANPMEFTDTGFVLNGVGGALNDSGGTYIYAAFAGSYSDFITDYNTDGSIDSRVKASDTTGFSIVSYVGTGANATVGHGLSSAPDWIVFRDRDTANNWGIYHSSLGETHSIKLNSSDAAFDEAAIFNDTAPTSSVISLGNSGLCNSSGNKMIAYCWTATTGRSAFGSYSGGTDGTSVTGLGFKPAWVIIKPSAGGTGGWRIYDNTRDVTNPTTKVLIADNSNAEADSSNSIDIDADGFTLNGTSTAHNGSGYTYIYAAFADTRDAAFWLDQSSNDNDWQPYNLDHNDTVADSPTNNFCTMNPIAKFGTPSAFTLADGNLDLTFTSTSGNDSAVATMGVSSGKFYYEVELVSHADDANAGFTTAEALATETNTNGAAYYKSIGFQRGDRGVVWGSEPSPTQRFNTLQDGDVVGFALDLDALKLYIYVNGSDSPVATLDVPTDKGDTFIPCCGDDGGDAGRFRFNFGQQPFKYGLPE